MMICLLAFGSTLILMTTHLHWVETGSASGQTIEREILEDGKTGASV